ncbi:hypothetical protein CEY16_07900 [Halalkalibacillus sediminis]|uniref:SpoVT-AbrB domain-containing protein n=1 Tax=Halalkalibacillus sediminis TaxID=2018042 RepID=A0A2I0QU23_9BACI|nr:AbrB/MazE/SpoVT family DNA-binding domain-containing protein [Halalkalibacillus sediminis]PKR77843.1 hypothetical protein CEY16_07900 [Halalkalibacillus sediminis]
MSQEFKRVRVSKQRQITIPKDFYDASGITDEVTIEFNGKEIIVRKAEYEQVDFSTDILRDLVEQGYEGKQLITKFEEIKAQIPNALNIMVEEAKKGPSFHSSDDLDEYLDALEDDEDQSPS